MERVCDRIYVCAGTGCMSVKAQAIYDNLLSELEASGCQDVKVVKTGCFGLCSLGPLVATKPDNCFYPNVDPDDVARIVQGHLVDGIPVDGLVYKDSSTGQTIPLFETDFYKKQMRIVFDRCGSMDPEDIDDYLAHDGFKALEKVLLTMSREEVVEVIKASGLRGRGGAGFPAGRKWEVTLNAPGDKKYVICNGDEGDPGAFMDEGLMEGDPLAIIEAMAIAAYAVGSDEGFIYVRAEYPLAVHRLTIAIDQARERGYLGNNIMGTGFSFNVSLRLGAGAFVCGETTAMVRSIEGLRGTPRLKPPSSAIKGLFGCPTLINNVETYANIGRIILNGAEWFRSIGTEGSTGTKVFALTGNVVNVGLVEVPMGTTLREIVFDIGGGIPEGRRFKAAQSGGPSGGCIPEEHLDIPIDFESLSSIGSIMGSGGLVIMDDRTCMVSIAKFFTEFMVEESCGKCPPCRIGLVRMLEILERITEGEGRMRDLDELEELSEMIIEMSFCGLGQTAPNPVLTTLMHFRDEYLAHIVEKRCPTGACCALLSYEITEACNGCKKCPRVCPTGAISGKKKERHVIDQSKCTKCGACLDECRYDAIIKA